MKKSLLLILALAVATQTCVAAKDSSSNTPVTSGGALSNGCKQTGCNGTMKWRNRSKVCDSCNKTANGTVVPPANAS